MTTQEKTAAIQKILANHQDNQTAVAAVTVQPGLDSFVVQAMNEHSRPTSQRFSASDPNARQPEAAQMSVTELREAHLESQRPAIIRRDEIIGKIGAVRP
jgi:hypothetical protein